MIHRLSRRTTSRVSTALLLLITLLPGIHSLEAASKAREFARQLNEAFVEVAEEVASSVVVIEVTAAPEPSATREEIESFLDKLPDWFKEQFLPDEDAPDSGTPQPRPRDPDAGQARANGSGVIIRKDGYILTNAHVVENAREIRVRLRDGREFAAEVRGVDELSEVAVIRIKDDTLEDLPVVRFADSDRVRVGEFAIAIGTPYALDYTVTVGHVSAKGRAAVIPPWMNGNQMDQDFIQTDANINPGNSGGPLVNLEGEVIGINTLIRGIGTGIGFAIPSNLARTISEELIAKGVYERAWLGVEIIDVNDLSDRETIAPGVRHGLVVRGIPKDAPAASSDLRPSDVIVSVNGNPVKNIQDLRAEVRSQPLGSTLEIGVSRQGKAMTIPVETGHLPESRMARIRGGLPRTPAPPAEVLPLGLRVSAITPELAERYAITQQNGVVITEVKPDSLAAGRGLEPGMVITDLDYEPVEDLADFQRLAMEADPEQGVLINYTDPAGNSRFVLLKE